MSFWGAHSTPRSTADSIIGDNIREQLCQYDFFIFSSFSVIFGFINEFFCILKKIGYGTDEASSLPG